MYLHRNLMLKAHNNIIYWRPSRVSVLISYNDYDTVMRFSLLRRRRRVFFCTHIIYFVRAVPVKRPRSYLPRDHGAFVDSERSDGRRWPAQDCRPRIDDGRAASGIENESIGWNTGASGSTRWAVGGAIDRWRRRRQSGSGDGRTRRPEKKKKNKRENVNGRGERAGGTGKTERVGKRFSPGGVRYALGQGRQFSRQIIDIGL